MVDVGRFLARVAVGVGVGWLLVRWGLARYPAELDVETDVLGAPVYSGFNGTVYTGIFLTVLAGCAAGLGTFLVLPRLVSVLRPRHRWAGFDLPDRAAVAHDLGLDRSGSVGRTAFLSGLIGLALSIAVFRTTPWILVGAAVLGLAIAVATTLLVRWKGPQVAARLHVSSPQLLAEVVLAVLTIPALAVTAAGSGVSVAGGPEQTINWFPPVLALALTAAAALWMARRLRSAGGVDGERELARLATVSFAVPVGLFLLTGEVTDAAFDVDLFHAGELSVPTTWFAAGYVPWRDLVSIHGFGQDGLFAMLGKYLAGDSIWGIGLGFDAVLWPAFYALQLLLISKLTDRNWVLMGLSAAVVTRYAGITIGPLWRESIPRTFAYPTVRFVLVAACLLLFCGAITPREGRTNRGYWLWLGFTLFTGGILFPETLPLAGLVGLAALLWCGHQRRLGAPQAFRPIAWAVAAVAAPAAALLVYLVSVGALGHFLSYFRDVTENHALTGAVPILRDSLDGGYVLVRHLPVVLGAGATLYLTARWRVRGFNPVDWTAAVLTAWTIMYYVKFLARADLGHGLHSNHMTLMLACYLIHRVLDPAERALLRTQAGRAVAKVASTRVLSMALAIAAVPLMGMQLTVAAANLDSRFHREVPQEVEVPRLGYTDPSDEDRILPAVDGDFLGDIGTLLDAAAGPDGAVFDFTNSPLLVHYLLDRPPPTRYYNISLAIRSRDQLALIEDLEESPPAVVVWSSTGGGLPMWDGLANWTRHYEVADWILDRYEPWAEVRGYALWVPRGTGADLSDPALLDLVEEPDTEDLYYESGACDWGLAPTYFSPRPAQADLARAVELTARPEPYLRVVGWAADGEVPAARVVALVDGEPVVDSAPEVTRLDLAAEFEDERGRSGFDLILPAADDAASAAAAVTVVAADDAGRAVVLGGPPVSDAALTALGLRLDRVGNSGLSGSLDSVAASSGGSRLYRFDLPQGAQDADWLAVRSPSPDRQTTLIFTSDPGPDDRNVELVVQAGEPDDLFLRIGACPQWRAFGSQLMAIADTDMGELAIQLVD